jgi:hypothetical protein
MAMAVTTWLHQFRMTIIVPTIKHLRMRAPGRVFAQICH